MPARSALAAEVLMVGKIEVTLKRSVKRRTLGLQVRHGVASALAPARMPRETILGFLQSKRDWLEKHVQAQAAQQPQAREWRDGDQVSFLGEGLTVRLSDIQRPERRENELHLPQLDAAGHLKTWTRRAVQEPYALMVQEYARQLGAQDRLGRVSVSDTRSRWGSCSADGNIRLHWALSRAPLEVLHYVALHEAAHLLELNHSARYWALVRQVMPGYAAQRQWLRGRGHVLLG